MIAFTSSRKITHKVTRISTAHPLKNKYTTYIPEWCRLVRRHVYSLGRSSHVKPFIIEVNYVVQRGVEQCHLVEKLTMKAFRALVPLCQQGWNSVGRGHDVIVLVHPTKRRGRYSRNMFQRAQCVKLTIWRSLRCLVNRIWNNYFFAFLKLYFGPRIEEFSKSGPWCRDRASIPSFSNLQNTHMLAPLT